MMVVVWSWSMSQPPSWQPQPHILPQGDPHVCWTAGQGTPRGRETMTIFVPDHHFLKPSSLDLSDLQETGRWVWGGREQLITGGGPGSPPPSPKPHCTLQEREAWLTTSCEGDLWAKQKNNSKKNRDIHVVSYRIPFWACFVMIRSVFLVQN